MTGLEPARTLPSHFSMYTPVMTNLPALPIELHSHQAINDYLITQLIISRARWDKVSLFTRVTVIDHYPIYRARICTLHDSLGMFQPAPTFKTQLLTINIVFLRLPIPPPVKPIFLFHSNELVHLRSNIKNPIGIYKSH